MSSFCTTDMLTKHSVRERIVTYFYILTTKSDVGTVVLEMTVELPEKYLCVNRSALCREIGRLRAEGIFGRVSRGVVLIRLKGG